MLSAYSTVTTPRVPPSSQPVTTTTTSMAVRIGPTGPPVRRTRPVMSPSRGPGPRWTPM